MHEIKFGELNGHAIGRILKETVRRATVLIRSKRLAFEVSKKQGYDDKEAMTDVFTDADKAAQEIYLRTFEECFPGYGVLGEEESLVIPASPERVGLYFTVDPLDGTKAFIRRQSHGVATMVALVDQGEVISAYIGDINTREVYGYRPGSNKVHRITELDTAEVLAATYSGSLSESYALLRDPADQHSSSVRRLLKQFKNHEVIGSSIGTWMAQLWKGEVGAAILRPGWETPWDSTPIIGISKKLGYAYLRPNDEGYWEEYEPNILPKVYRREHETLVIHRNILHALER